MSTITQPTLQDDEKSMTQIYAKIKQLEANLAKQGAAPQRKDQLLLDLNQEYEKLSQKRQDQCNTLAEQWQSYQRHQKESRQTEIGKRQVEFDKQLDDFDQEKRRIWSLHNKQDKSAISNQLLTYLQQYSTDNRILTFPPDILDMFWAIDIQIPVLENELATTIEKVKEVAN